MSDNDRRRVAYIEDADDDGNVHENATRTAASIAPSSPTKQQPNTRKSRRTPSSPLAHSDHSVSSEDQDAGAELVSHRRGGESSLRPKETSKAQKRVSYEHRPAPPRQRTAPTAHGVSSRRMSHHEEPSYYGREPTTYGGHGDPVVVPAVSRPRARTSTTNPAHRHSSYHGTSRPPLANAKYQYVQPSIMTQLPPPSFPPPPWSISAPPQPMRIPHPSHRHMQQPPPPPPPAQDFYPNTRSLSSRFTHGSVDARPMSALAFRPRHNPVEDYEQENRPLVTRRPSKSRRREDEDRQRMPPPPPPAPPARASTTMPLTHRSSAFAAPPRQSTPVSYDDHNPFQGEVGSYDLSPIQYDSYTMPSTRQRRPSIDHSASYDQDGYHTEVAARLNRRNSQYGGAPVSDVEDKLRAAQRYQNPEPSLPLTTEALRKASKGGSSRSTRSTASRDESDYRQAATATTRTSVEDDVTIRVKGIATLKLAGGAELQCADGAEINFTRGGGPGDRGSDRSSYIDPDEQYHDDQRHEERRGRSDRPPARIRAASSQAGSYSRTTPAYERYDRAPDNYGTSPYGFHPPPLPPPPLEDPYSSSPYRERFSYFQ